MGKNNKKQAKGAKSSDKTGGDVPRFDESALMALTAKIENGFGGSKTKEEKPINNTNGSKKVGGAPISKAKAVESARGTKRDSKGNAKQSEKHQKSRSGPKPEAQTGAAKDDKAALLAEIIALGGTEEDLELVADAFSDDEDVETGNAAPDKSFKNDLAAFVAGLGIEGAVMPDDDEPDVKGEEGVMDEDWEEDSEGNSSDEAPELQTVPTPAPVASAAMPVHNDPNRLVFQAQPDWHAAPLGPLPNPVVDEASRYREAMANLKIYAKSLLEADNNLYASKHLSASSSHRFLSTIMTSGTLSDKVSALTLVVQESPVHTTKSFESLLTLAKKNSRGQAVTALGALKDLLAMGVVLPADRRLRTFASQPGLLGTLQDTSVSTWHNGQPLPGGITKAHLISWAYEDWLKESYFDMIKVLEGWCSDEIEYSRSRAVTYVYELLKEKPEQEANLLRLLVNKLGDPDKKIASRTSYLLLQLQISHPLMKPIIIHSIENELLLRPGQSSHAKYYAINTLNQTILSGKEEEVAKKLLGIFFELFVTLLKKPETKPLDAVQVNRKGQIQGGGAPMGKKAKAKVTKEEEAKLASEETTEKMISAVLTGVNRAFPFSKSDDLTLEKHMDTLFRITHSSNFNTSIQALMLIEQLATSKHLSVDRFYRTLYESLLDPRLITSSKHALYLNLLFRALKADLNIKRVKAFVKRMLQIVTLHQPPFICGILYLVKELEATFPGLKSLFSDPEEIDGDGDEVIRDVPEEGDDVPDYNTSKKPDYSTLYDGRKRDPEHSNADKSCIWEIVPFLVHFHPSVSLFASRLLNDEKMPPKPDLASHTLASFLDRFVYRNAKSAASSGGPRGGSIMQPLSGGDSRGVLISNKSATHMQGPLNTEAFWRKKAEDVAVDEVFFHKYFSQIGKGKQASKAKPTKGEDGSENGEDENEDEIWDALVNSRPDVEGPSDSESDMEMHDLDSSDAELSDDDEVIINMDDDDDAEGSDMADDDGFETEEEDGSEDGGVVLDDDESEADSEMDALFAKELEKAKTDEEPAAEGEKETSRQKKKKLKGLPTFASAEDYASMLDNDADEDF